MIKKLTLVILLLAIVSFFIIRYDYINDNYPAPVQNKIAINSTLTINNNSLSVNSYQLTYMSDLTNSVYTGVNDVEDPLVMLINIQVKNKTSYSNLFELSNLTLQSDGWINSIDLDLFLELNSKIDSVYINLNSNQSLQLKLPYLIYKTQFTESQWKKINNRQFSLICSLYPIKNEFIIY